MSDSVLECDSLEGTPFSDSPLSMFFLELKKRNPIDHPSLFSFFHVVFLFLAPFFASDESSLPRRVLLIRVPKAVPLSFSVT